MNNDVVITGVGLLTPLGETAARTCDAWKSGDSAQRKLLPELAETPLRNCEVAELPPFDAGARLGGRRMLKYMSGAAVLGCIAAREAMHQAEVALRFPPERVGLYAGSGLAAADLAEVQELVSRSIDSDGILSCRLLGEQGLPAANPLVSFKILANMPACLISILENIKGPNLILTPWEGQTAAALREAWKAVTCGEVDCAVAGAADSAAHPATTVYLRQAGLLSENEFPASAAGYLVLERAETASRDNKQEMARVTDIQVADCAHDLHDPLSARMGRTYAAAPAVALALAVMCGDTAVSICGVDGQAITMTLDRFE